MRCWLEFGGDGRDDDAEVTVCRLGGWKERLARCRERSGLWHGFEGSAGGYFLNV